LGLTVGATAADLPRRAAPPVFAPVPIFTWTGFYVGVNAGYGFGDEDDNNLGSYFLPAGSVINSPGTAGTLTVLNGFGFNNDNDNEGFVGGGQIGYNYQIGSFVIGVEADIQWADLGGGNNNLGFGLVPGAYTFVGVPGLAFAGGPAVFTNGGVNNDIEWFGTVRARLGVAFDRALIYATGGFAYASGGDDNNNCLGFAGAGFGFGCGNGGDDWRSGWTVGGGVEYAFTNNLSVKLEGLYVNLDSDNNNNFGSVYVPATNQLFVSYNASNNENEFFVVRAGVNFRFGTW
jgi:outer membrane immunogenic protein